MTEQAISPLCRRMIEDMAIRKFAQKTQHDYVQRVKLSRLFRRLLLEKLAAAHNAGALEFFGKHAALTHAQAFAAYLAPPA
jgi:hypothetical protein